MSQVSKRPSSTATDQPALLRKQLFSTIAAMLGGGCIAMPAAAGEFQLENGAEGKWTLNASVGVGRRMRGPDDALISTVHGGRGGSSNDDGELNYDKGAIFTSIARLSGEVLIKQDKVGVLIGAKGWYDYTGKRSDVAHGNFGNGYMAGRPLDDAGFDRLTKFSGAELGNAYVFADLDLAANMPVNVKLGNHVVNWGESLFIPGINQFGAFDVTAANRPGAQVKDILLPIPQLSANLGLAEGLSLDVFYQFRWRKTVLDGCGTYWSLSDLLNCPAGALVGGDALGLSDRSQFAGVPVAPGVPDINFRMRRAPDKEPRNGGQFGLALHYFSAALDTDLGAYVVNYHQRTPIVTALKTASPNNSAWGTILPPMQYQFDYSAENIKVVGASASTVLKGWTVSGEISHSRDIPVQINAVDLVLGTGFGIGPQGAAGSAAPGSYIRGYDLKNRTQVQLSTIRIVPQLMAAESLTLIGEAAYQRWSGIGEPGTGPRYGRNFVYGMGQSATVACAATANPNPDYCENKGYFTSNAWGYRVLAELSYPNAYAGVNLKPRLFWSHDVKGYAADAAFSAHRQILALGLRAEYNSRYYGDISYTRFNRNAKYDVLHDRDFVSVVAGINF
ncbi:DUF1302 domain-containing protein [Pseudoduganella namucuonensis]|uniref:DUF1302 domain-containing protein n=1 Tax=Pseudoduganella namucuonensis TaxID=1035707 RepID=A0A1I7LRV5_9BURK|nr:DUF1302 domain-containing protein [Pseudoduganella namucuonensis]SFV12436.1 Protein of unknown function [Pseudoduganella namucuonensis]